MSLLTLQLRDQELGHKAYKAAWPKIKELLESSELTLEVKKSTRSDAANRLLHATIAEIAKQIEWAGKKRDTEVWKRLLTASWLRARGEQLEILPAIDGHGVDIVFQRTSKLNRAECSELQEYIFAWGVEAGVRFPVYEGM